MPPVSLLQSNRFDRRFQRQQREIECDATQRQHIIVEAETKLGLLRFVHVFGVGDRVGRLALRCGCTRYRLLGSIVVLWPPRRSPATYSTVATSTLVVRSPPGA